MLALNQGMHTTLKLRAEMTDIEGIDSPIHETKAVCRRDNRVALNIEN